MLACILAAWDSVEQSDSIIIAAIAIPLVSRFYYNLSLLELIREKLGIMDYD